MQYLIFLNDISPFFGRFHPLFVHLPIGFILMAYLMELASRWKKYTHLKDSVLFVLWIGGISGIFTVITGYILAQSGGYGKAPLFWHQWSGIGLSLLVFLAIFIHKSKAFFPVFNMAILLLLVTGHLGGNLTHGETYLTEHLPEELKDVLGIESDVYIVENVSYEEAELYPHLVYPILHNKCVSCHNASKMKGELNMKDFESFLKGGENGEVVIKGNSNKSDLFHRINLPEEDEDTMPPEGKERITDDEMRLIALWIDQDLEKNTPLDSLEIAPDIVEDIEFRLSSKGVELSPVFDLKISESPEINLTLLRDLGFNVTPVAQKSPFLQVAYFDRTTPLNETSKNALLAVSKQLVWLDLTGAKNQDDNWDFIQSFPNLTKLYLSNTKVESTNISALNKNQYLEILSLFGTAIDSSNLKQLIQLPHLKSLYIGNSKVLPKDTIDLNLESNENLKIHF